MSYLAVLAIEAHVSTVNTLQHLGVIGADEAVGLAYAEEGFIRQDPWMGSDHSVAPTNSMTLSVARLEPFPLHGKTQPCLCYSSFHPASLGDRLSSTSPVHDVW